MTENLTKLEILAKIDSGEISAEEGVTLLAGLDKESNPHKKEENSSPGSAMDILEKIDKGEISAEEGVHKFQAGAESSSAEEPAAETTVNISSDEDGYETLEGIRNDPAFKRWQTFWQIPTWLGLGIMIISSLWLFNSYENGQTFWFILSWVPFLIGLLITYFGWTSRNSTWVHVRIKSGKGNDNVNISISVPLPLGIGKWFLRSFGGFIPKLEGQSLDILLDALDKKNLNAPLIVDVDDDDGEEKVQVIIG